jgi:hypothetical protein
VKYSSQVEVLLVKRVLGSLDGPGSGSWVWAVSLLVLWVTFLGDDISVTLGSVLIWNVYFMVLRK